MVAVKNLVIGVATQAKVIVDKSAVEDSLIVLNVNPLWVSLKISCSVQTAFHFLRGSLFHILLWPTWKDRRPVA
jgi:hypothetical protein